MAHTGRLDLLFNNAGRGLPAVPLQDVPLDDFQSIVAINLVAVSSHTPGSGSAVDADAATPC